MKFSDSAAGGDPIKLANPSLARYVQFRPIITKPGSVFLKLQIFGCKLKGKQYCWHQFPKGGGICFGLCPSESFTLVVQGYAFVDTAQ